MRITLTLLFIAFTWTYSSGQSSQKKHADKLFDRIAYAKAIPIYKRILKRKKADPDAAFKLAECYRLTRDYDRAEEMYQKVMDWEEKPVEAYFNYGHLLLQQGKYQMAGEMFAEFSNRVPEDKRGRRFFDALDRIQSMFADSAAIELELMSFNSEASDFSACRYNGGIVFSSSRDPGDAVVKVYEGTGGYFLDLYYVKETGRKDTVWSSPKPMKGDLNTKFHESNFVVARDSSEEAWFTRNNYFKNKKGKSDEKMMLLKLYKAQMKGFKGTKIEEFVHNSDNTNMTHPAMSPNGNKLYFVSDMEGGMGGKDIYYCDKTGDNWGIPQNMGSSVNTKGDELFPFISSEGIFYFASDGHAGLGNLDIFSLDLSKGETALNIGYPFNSPFDDFSYFMSEDKETGFFTSNRPGGMGDDDIYGFTIRRPSVEIYVSDSISKFPVGGAELVLFSSSGQELTSYFTDSVGKVSFKTDRGNFRIQAVTTDFIPYQFEFSTQSESGQTDFSYNINLYNPPPAITALVVDEASGLKLKGAEIKLVNLSELDTLLRTSDRYGRFSAKLDRNSHYELWVKYPGYLVFKKHVSTTFDAYDGDTIIPMSLEPVEINKVIRLDHIHYEFDRAEIRPSDYPDLLELTTLLKDNPEIRIELSSHTDSRGRDAYNENLSQRRAESAREFLIRAGVAGNRIEAKGYGESKLLNKCEDGVECEEDDHFLNRRTEFRIIGYIDGVNIEYENGKPD